MSNNQKLNIFGREFNLEVVFDQHTDEEVLPSQKDALIRFLAVADDLLNNAVQPLREFCLQRSGDEMSSINVENIFEYVLPKSIYVQRTTDNSHIVGLMCDYKFDPDNGIAVVFKNETLDRIGTQNIIL